MSRMSAFTTLRLIGSPTNPPWPYWRPCPGCRDMLSLAGDDTPCDGVGETSGRGGSAAEVFRATVTLVFAVPLASAKLLRHKPLAHASANVLMATFLKCLGIVPSSGITHLNLPALHDSSVCCQK